MSPNKLHLECSLDKELYYHGETISVNVHIQVSQMYHLHWCILCEIKLRRWQYLANQCWAYSGTFGAWQNKAWWCMLWHGNRLCTNACLNESLQLHTCRCWEKMISFLIIEGRLLNENRYQAGLVWSLLSTKLLENWMASDVGWGHYHWRTLFWLAFHWFCLKFTLTVNEAQADHQVL